MNYDTLSITDIISKIAENSNKIKSFQGEGSIDFDSPDNSNSASITVNRDVANDSIYAKISGIFGITGALISINKNNFVFYNVQSNYVIIGSSTKENLTSILKINISYNELKDILSASFSLDSSSQNCKIDLNDDSYILTGYISNQFKKYYIDTKFYTVSRFMQYDSTGKIDYEVDYKNYEYSEGIYFPMEINFNIPAKDENIIIKYSKIDLNPGNLKFNFKFSKNAAIYKWK